MKTYFHVDRRQGFTAGQHSQLSKLDLSHAQDLGQHLDILCPNGVSAHGNQYLNSDVKSGKGEAAIELIWEYVRRAHFPERPSRLTSTFAWQSLEEAKAFRLDSGLTDANIWQIEAAEGFVANMALLNIGTSVLRASQFAHAYWAGEVGPQIKGLKARCWEVLLTGPITVVGEA
ncbi:DUF2441 domain-containing protein [Cupriavidus sp. IK-TO18]|jgi:hypothetical protein|uniref:DUF2441 domain-containing protein n=1 Tax=Cupriavidus sp. IK-TO18 TaxID=2782182 RepID=UPI00189B2C73|nr:DUF2441 domain-containing protein [Cupriavidus sp. IK-TO18]MBF6989304.1 DUF2441 domain-containing protein [Cupriavidus sp. IK-TO18]